MSTWRRPGAADSRSYNVTLGPGSATLFQPMESIGISADADARTAGVADVTGDGREDVLLATGYSLGSEDGEKLFVFAQRPDGTLAPPVRYAPDARSFIFFAVLDTNGDGRQDVAINTVSGINVLRQTVSGTLESAGFLPAKGSPVAADMDGDGDSDLVANDDAVGVTLLTQGDGGTFTATPVTTDDVAEVEVGDVDGLPGQRARAERRRRIRQRRALPGLGHSRDGRSRRYHGRLPPRRGHVHGGWSTLSVLPQTDDGSLGTPIKAGISYASSYTFQGLALGDINGDKRTDAVVADYNYGLVVLRNNNGPTRGGPQAWVRDVAPADFASEVVPAAVPSVTFQRAVAAEAVSSSTVRLVNGRTGAAVATSVSYDAGSRTAWVTPAVALQVETPRVLGSAMLSPGGRIEIVRPGA
jgi:FG-GAP-like repeat/Bacterial Ig-like domain